MTVIQGNDLAELLKWARRASQMERFAKLQTARFILRERRLRCRIVGCTNPGSDLPCARCGARGRVPGVEPAAQRSSA